MSVLEFEVQISTLVKELTKKPPTTWKVANGTFSTSLKTLKRVVYIEGVTEESTNFS